jgi:hypothetical protein
VEADKARFGIFSTSGCKSATAGHWQLRRVSAPAALIRTPSSEIKDTRLRTRNIPAVRRVHWSIAAIGRIRRAGALSAKVYTKLGSTKICSQFADVISVGYRDYRFAETGYLFCLIGRIFSRR